MIPAEPTDRATPRSVRRVYLLLCAGLVPAALVVAAWHMAAAPGPHAVAPAPTAEQRAASHAAMLGALREIAARTREESPYLGSAGATRLAARARALAADDRSADAAELCFEAGQALVRLGELQPGIELLEAAYARIGSLPAGRADLLRFKLGVAHMRLGETENCCANNRPESCILPFAPAALHKVPRGSRQAIRYFLEVLRTPDAPQSGPLHTGYAARWLLNVACMTLGEYPAGVPAGFLIPPARFTAEVAGFPRFVNVAHKLGLDTFSMCGGVIADDFDGDGLLDVVTSTWDPEGQLRLFINNGNGTFTDKTAAAGLTGLCGGLNILQTDYDNDGHLDILVLRGAWLGAAGRHPNSLIRNNGDGTFSDVTFATGLGAAHYPTQTAAWADYDLDGDLDLYVGNEHSAGAHAPSQLFRNDGDGTFTDVAAAAGVENLRYAKGVTWGDFDEDGDPDLYVSNYTGANRLYRNEGDGTFTDVAPELGVTSPRVSFPTWFWDYDNDGHLDLFVASYTGRVDHLGAHYMGRATDYERPALYRGDGRGGFTDVTRMVGLEYPMLPMGSNFGDLDNDGDLDMYLGTGDPEYESLMPNLMFLNLDGRGFENVTMASGFGHLQKGHGIAFADLDNDGDADVLEQMGGAFPGDRYGDAVFANPGFQNHWLAVKLVGTVCNRAAIGARLAAEVRRPDGTLRTIYRHVNSGGSFGSNPLRQTLGLGAATRVETLRVYWPRSGRTQVLHDLEADHVIEVVEGAADYQKVTLPRFDLGG